MQTMRQQKALSDYTKNDELPQWEHNWNGRPCRQEDFERDRFDRHVLPKKVDTAVFWVCVAGVIIFYALGWM